MHRNLKKTASSACALLAKRYGRKVPKWAGKPKDVIASLVQVILSQNTSDRNSQRAYAKLRAKYPAWVKVFKAPTKEIATTIREGGLANIKAKRIKEALQEISRREGRFSLESLRRMPAESAREYLTSINGVGPKTAAVVLVFSLGHPFFPVDTHVYRVARRVGFYGEKTSREKAHEIMDVLVPNGEKQVCHVNMITLGRQVCRPRNPECGKCPLVSICDYGQKKGFEEWLGRRGAWKERSGLFGGSPQAIGKKEWKS